MLIYVNDRNRCLGFVLCILPNRATVVWIGDEAYMRIGVYTALELTLSNFANLESSSIKQIVGRHSGID